MGRWRASAARLRGFDGAAPGRESATAWRNTGLRPLGPRPHRHAPARHRSRASGLTTPRRSTGKLLCRAFRRGLRANARMFAGGGPVLESAMKKTGGRLRGPARSTSGCGSGRRADAGVRVVCGRGRDQLPPTRRAAGPNRRRAALSGRRSQPALAAIIIYWNNAEARRGRLRQAEDRFAIPAEFLAHVSPLGWEHINLTGEYPLVAHRLHGPREILSVGSRA